ncbi:MAG: hypothetical protein M0R40_04025 [Firmicutes bacterium]|nr:hypothetical protein [Bacillota bacterium]
MKYSAMLIIILFLICSMIFPVCVWADDDYTMAATNKLDLLKAMDIFNVDAEQAYVTAGELAHTLCGMMAVDGCNNQQEAFSYLLKIPAFSHWRNYSISGYASYEMLLRALLYALGYDAFFESSDIFSLAVKTKIIGRDADFPAKYIMRSQAAALIYNALNTEVHFISSVIGGVSESLLNAKSTKYKGNTLLKAYHDIDKGKGLIYANSQTNLSSDKIVMPKGWIEIDGIRLYAKNTNAEQYLGYEVEYFYKAEEQKLIFIHSLGREVKIDSDEIISYENNVLKYSDKKGRIHSANIPRNAWTVFNNKCSDVTGDDLAMEDGYVRLIDSNSNGNYEVLIVLSFETYVVNRIAPSDGIVYAKHGKESLHITSSDYIIQGNSLLELDDLHENSVLSVAKSKGAGKTYIYVGERVIRGVVQSISADSIDVEGSSYRYTLVSDMISNIRLNMEGYFYLTVTGKIAAAKFEDAKFFEYGYLLGCETEQLNNTLRLRVYTQENEIKIFETARRIQVNGGHQSNKNEILKVIPKNGEMIKYSLNDDDAIINLFTVNGSDEEDAIVEFVSQKQLRFKRATGILEDVDNGYHPFVAITANTKVFRIGNNEEDHVVVAPGMLTNETTYTVTAYDLDECMIAGCIAIFEGIYDNYNNTVFVFDKITDSIDENGEHLIKMYGFERGVAVSYYLRNTQELSQTVEGFKRGDILQYAMGKDKKIAGLKSVFTAEKNAEHVYIQPDGKNTKFVAMYGNVLKYNTGIMLMQYKVQGVDTKAPFPTGGTYLRVYEYDEKTDKIYLATVDDIKPGLNLFIMMSYGNPYDVVIYR